MHSILQILIGIGLTSPVPAKTTNPVPVATKRPGRSKRTRPRVPKKPKPGSPALAGTEKTEAIRSVAKSIGVPALSTKKVFNVEFDNVTQGAFLVVLKASVNAFPGGLSVGLPPKPFNLFVTVPGKPGATYLVDCGLPESEGEEFRHDGSELAFPNPSGSGGDATVQGGRLVFAHRFRSDKPIPLQFTFHPKGKRSFVFTGCVVTELTPVATTTSSVPPKVLK